MGCDRVYPYRVLFLDCQRIFYGQASNGENSLPPISCANPLSSSLLVVLYQAFQFDADTAVFIAFCTFVGSEIVVFLYLLNMFIIQYQRIKKEPSEFISGRSVRRNLISVSVPTTALRVFHALTHAIQPFLIKGRF